MLVTLKVSLLPAKMQGEEAMLLTPSCNVPFEPF